MENLQHEVMANFRRRNKTVRAWTKERSFCLRTVGAVIRGEVCCNGSRGPVAVKSLAIRQALIADGFWPPETQPTPDESGTHRNNS